MFIVMIIFQFSGALILLLNSVDTRKKTIIRQCFLGMNFAIRDDNDNCSISKKELRKSARSTYLNIAAFVDLVIGYALAAFNFSHELPAILVGILIIIGSLLLSGAEYGISHAMANRNYKEDLIISYKYLEAMGIESPVATPKETKEYLGIQ